MLHLTFLIWSSFSFVKWKASKWTANIFLKRTDESVVTELLSITPKRQVFIHEAGTRETSAEAFPPGWNSGVPGKLSPEINPSSVIGSMIKLLSLCITPPHINPKSLPPQPHTSLCQSRHLESCQAEGEKNRFCSCPTWELLPLCNGVATQPALLRPASSWGGWQAPTSTECSKVLQRIWKVRRDFRRFLPSAERSHLREKPFCMN